MIEINNGDILTMKLEGEAKIWEGGKNFVHFNVDEIHILTPYAYDRLMRWSWLPRNINRFFKMTIWRIKKEPCQ